MVLFYDTETSDLPRFGEPSSNPDQPHIVQLAASLVESTTGKDLASINLTSIQDGWRSAHEAQQIHGVTPARADAIGVPEFLIVRTFLDLWRHAERRVGHSEKFDAKVMRIAFKRYTSAAVADEWSAGKADCTHAMAKKHVQDLPKAGGGSLRAVYRHFYGFDFEDAHTAQADMRACQLVWQVMHTPERTP
jgi:DNA polymerase-3 subunit epsilon